MTIISLFYCCEKGFILMNIWMIGKNSMKHHYLKKKIFTVTRIWKILLMQITCTQRVCRDFEIKKLGEYHDVMIHMFKTIKIVKK